MPLHERDRDAIIPTYDRSPLTIVRGEGCYLYDENGREYLDLVAGLGVNALGHNHPEVIDAVDRQIRKYAHLSNLYVQEPQVVLAERLLKRSPGMSGVFFCNSGTEATEGAMKLARKWGGARGKSGLIGFTKGFHGRTTGALAIMATEKYREGFGPFIEDCTILPYNDTVALHSGIDEHTAAVFLEFLQGEGGVVPATDEFVAEIETLRKQYGFLMVADEIQAGVGRTGKFYSYEWNGIVPDVICVAKAIGGGLPLGAILMRNDLREVYGMGRHGTTFGGNPVACAAGIAVLDCIRSEALLERISFTSAIFFDYFLDAMHRYPAFIRDVRGRGLMIGIELHRPAASIRDSLTARGILVNITQGNVIRLLPPFILSKADALRSIASFEEVFSALAAETTLADSQSP